MEFSLIVPLWNESTNVAELIRVIANSDLLKLGMAELVLVNNGSEDNTGALIEEGARHYPWIVPVHLGVNMDYGGGVYEGFKYAHSDIICYIPGDLQIMPDDVEKVCREFFSSSHPRSKLLVKGRRTIRHDPIQTQLVSHVYTFLANRILRLDINDVNGLPKMFHRDLMDLAPEKRMKTFVFDAQVLSLARTHGWRIEEIPVTFHGRREGVSSWSRKRVRIYFKVFRQLIMLRSIRHAPGVPLERLR